MKISSAGCVWPHLYHQVAFQVRVSKRVSGVNVRIRCFWSHKTSAERQCPCGISLNFGLRRNRQDLDSKLASLYRRDYVDPRWELIWIELLFISLCKEEGENIPAGGDYKCFFLKDHLLWLLSFLDLKVLRLLWCNCSALGISCVLSELGETAVMFVLKAVVLCALLGGAGAQSCPSQCSCSGTAVDCHGQSLRSVPRNIPRNAERLWVRRNTLHLHNYNEQYFTIVITLCIYYTFGPQNNSNDFYYSLYEL